MRILRQQEIDNFDNLLSIEHLIPQSLGGDNPDEEFESKVGQLGNLVLIPDTLNSRMGDKNFVDKRKILRKEGFQFDLVLDSVLDFDFGVAERRTQELAERAYKSVWNLH